MIDSLKNLDTQLVLFFNHLNNPFLDFFFFWVSDKLVWIPFYAIIAWFVYKHDRSYFFVVLVFIAAAIAVSDQVSSTLIKQNVMRLRPCHDPDISSQIHLVNNYCGGKFGFVSSHASNVFTLAAFLSGFFKGQKTALCRIIWVWAVVVSFSRIYLGAHFPGDVIGGALLGIFTGILFIKLFSLFKLKYKKYYVN